MKKRREQTKSISANALNDSSRRDFLTSSARCLLASVLSANLAKISECGTFGGFWTAHGELPSSPNWNQLERHLKGDLLRSKSRGYADVIRVRNLRYSHVHPSGVAMALNAQDVATAVKWSQDNNVEMVVRSGGHSFAGYSTTTGLVINLNAMTRLSIDHKASTMTAFGAPTNAGVAAAGKPFGLALPGGICPTVGIPGFVLGGGLGFYSREHGLGIDSLLETHMVSGSGDLLIASEHENADLFWALRGAGGGNFGINTSFKFKTFHVPRRVTVFSLTWNGQDCVAAFMKLQEFVLSAPRSVGLVAAFSTSYDNGSLVPSVRAYGQFTGSKEALGKMFRSVTSAVKPSEMYIKELSFWDAKVWLAKDEGPPNLFDERSRFHPEPMGEEGVRTIVNAMSKPPIGKNNDMFVGSVFFALGGEIQRVHPSETAYFHRKDVWLQTIACSWNRDVPAARVEQLIAWQNELYESMSRFASARAFVNFVDPNLKDYMASYYGQNQQRLIEAKWKYDPRNSFRFPQSILT